jgi:hypothetical protein
VSHFSGQHNFCLLYGQTSGVSCHWLVLNRAVLFQP